MKPRMTLDRLNAGSPLLSSWIQRLIPEALSCDVDQSRNAEVGTGDHGQNCTDLCGTDINTEQQSLHGVRIQQSEDHPHEDRHARMFALGDYRRHHTSNIPDFNPCVIGYDALEEPLVTQPGAKVYPIQLPTVESLLPYTKKGKENDFSLTATDANNSTKFLGRTRESNGLTQSFHTKESNCFPHFEPFTVTNRTHLMPDPFVEMIPTSVLLKGSSLSVREHYLSENRNTAAKSAAARALGGRSYHLREPWGREMACVSEILPVDNWAKGFIELDTELSQASLHIYDILSTDSESVLLKDKLEDHGKSASSQPVGRCSSGLVTDKNLEALPSESKHLQCLESIFSEPNATSKSHARVSFEEETALHRVVPPPNKAGVSVQMCDVKCAKPVLDSVMPLSLRCVHLESNASQGCQFEKLGNSITKFEGNINGLDVGVEWQFPAPAIRNNIQQQSGNVSTTANLPPDLSDDALPKDKLTEIRCSCNISDRSNRGEMRSANDSIQRCLKCLEMDAFPERDSTGYWHSYQKSPIGDRFESFAFKKPQEHKISLISGVGVWPKSEFGNGIEFSEKFQKAAVAEAKLQTGGFDGEQLLRDASFSNGHLVNLIRPVAGSHLNTIKRDTYANRQSKMKTDDHAVLGKRSRFEELQVAGSMLQNSDKKVLDANGCSTGVGYDGNKKMWIHRWCTATSKKSFVKNIKSQNLHPFGYIGDSGNQICTGSASRQTSDIQLLTKTENDKRRSSLQHKTSIAFSRLASKAIKNHYQANRSQSHFRKQFCNPSAGAMAIIGVTARQMHATNPQKNGLFGSWSSPKNLTRQVSGPQEVALTPAGLKPELTNDIMLSSTECSVTPEYM